MVHGILREILYERYSVAEVRMKIFCGQFPETPMKVMKQKLPRAMLRGRLMRSITLTHDEGTDFAVDVRVPVKKGHLLLDRFTNQCGWSYSFIEFLVLRGEYVKSIQRSNEIISLQFFCNILMKLVTINLLENHSRQAFSYYSRGTLNIQFFEHCLY